jgi:Uma2 family endonuclease
MSKRITTEEYLRLPETNRPMELVYGYVREPPTPFGDHQSAVFRVAVLLDTHVRHHGLGRVFISPLDVVLDPEAALIVQPDVLFIAGSRLNIVRGHVWGAPDLVVEVSSPSTQHHDETLKLAWYRQYGVTECWLVYPRERQIQVVNCENDARSMFARDEPITSKVLAEFDQPAGACFV